MLTTQPETYPEAGITIARAAFEPEIAQQLVKDCRYFMGLPEGASYEDHASKGEKSRRPVRSRIFFADGLRELGRPATTTVLDALADTPDHRVQINRQPAFSQQAYHRDRYLKKPVWVVHPSPSGLLHVAPEAASKEQAEEEDPATFLLEAGDVVGQYRPYELHRGGNTSEKVRYNMVVFCPKADFE